MKKDMISQDKHKPIGWLLIINIISLIVVIIMFSILGSDLEGYVYNTSNEVMAMKVISSLSFVIFLGTGSMMIWR